MFMGQGCVLSKISLTSPPRGGVLLGIFGGGVPPASRNPDPTSDQKMQFPTPVFRPGLKHPYAYASVLNGIQRNKDE